MLPQDKVAQLTRILDAVVRQAEKGFVIGSRPGKRCHSRKQMTAPNADPSWANETSQHFAGDKACAQHTPHKKDRTSCSLDLEAPECPVARRWPRAAGGCGTRVDAGRSSRCAGFHVRCRCWSRYWRQCRSLPVSTSRVLRGPPSQATRCGRHRGACRRAA